LGEVAIGADTIDFLYTSRGVMHMFFFSSIKKESLRGVIKKEERGTADKEGEAAMEKCTPIEKKEHTQQEIRKGRSEG